MIITGFNELDRKLGGGLRNGCLYLIAARPDMGKTSFALNILEHISARDERTAVFFSIELPQRIIVNRILSMRSGVDEEKIAQGRLEQEDWKRLSKASETISASNMILDDTASINIKELERRCRKYKTEKSVLSVIFVDYLQLINGYDNSDTYKDVSRDAMRSLKSLAKELDTPIVVLSQLSKSAEYRKDHRPILSDLDGIGVENQYADTVMFIYRDEYYSPDTERRGIAEIIIEKNRGASLGTLELVWVARLTKFFNMPEER